MKRYITPQSKTTIIKEEIVCSSDLERLGVGTQSLYSGEVDSKSRNPLNFGDEDFGFGEEE